MAICVQNSPYHRLSIAEGDYHRANPTMMCRRHELWGNEPIKNEPRRGSPPSFASAPDKVATRMTTPPGLSLLYKPH